MLKRGDSIEKVNKRIEDDDILERLKKVTFDITIHKESLIEDVKEELYDLIFKS